MQLIKTTSIFVLSVIFLASCIKSKDINFAAQDSPTPNTVDFNSQKTTASFDIVSTPTIYTFYVELNSSTNSYPSGDVTIAKANNLVTAGGQEVLPDSAYQLVNTTATIDPTTHLAAFQLKVFTTKIDLTHDFALGFTITSFSGGATIATNKDNTVITIGAKNRYDGHYSVTGTMVDFSNAALTGRYPMDVDLVTVNGNTVYMVDNAIGIAAHSISNGGGLSYYGSFAPEFSFDANDNIISVVNYYGQTSGNGRSAQLDPSGTNKWHSSDKSMDAKYWMNQPTVITPHRTAFDEHFTYLGPR